MAVAAKGEMLKLEGIRAELAVVRTARCAAAWDNRAIGGRSRRRRGLGSLPRLSRARPAEFSYRPPQRHRRRNTASLPEPRLRARRRLHWILTPIPKSSRRLKRYRTATFKIGGAGRLTDPWSRAIRSAVRWFFGKTKRPDLLARIVGVFGREWDGYRTEPPCICGIVFLPAKKTFGAFWMPADPPA